MNQEGSSEQNIYTVSQFSAVINQLLEHAFPFVRIQGEVSGFRVSQGKWVSFRLKDENAIVDCFMGVWQLRTEIEDGMQVVVEGSPRLSSKWGKFSISTQSVRPVGEGALHRAYLLLKQKLDKQGLFDPSRKRMLPDFPEHIGVISSEQAAGYADFRKILRARWPIAKLSFAHVAVQGRDSADQIIQALKHFNQLPNPPAALAIIRGGGAAEDLASFNDELLVRTVAESRIPTVVGVGHEVDQTLAEMAADVAASTPSNAAELLSPDMAELKQQITATQQGLQSRANHIIYRYKVNLDEFAGTVKKFIYQHQRTITHTEHTIKMAIEQQLRFARQRLNSIDSLLKQTSPRRQLERGFAIVRDKQKVVRSAREVKTNDRLDIEFKDGHVASTVQ